MTASRIRWLVLALVYGAFYVWYGGSGTPMSDAEVERFVAIAAERDERAAAVIRKFASTDDEKEIVMVNLNQYRERAAYEDGRETEGSAREAESRYISKIVPRLFARACHPLVGVDPIVHMGLGEAVRHPWDRATMVRYRSRRDFLEFMLSPEFDVDVDHKWAALERTHVFPSTPVISFATIRTVPLLLLLSVGLLLDRVLDRARSTAGRQGEST